MPEIKYVSTETSVPAILFTEHEALYLRSILMNINWEAQGSDNEAIIYSIYDTLGEITTDLVDLEEDAVVRKWFGEYQ